MTTGLIFAPGLKHTQAGHPEHAGRATAVWDRLVAADVLKQMTVLPPRAATWDELGRVHVRQQIELVTQASLQGGGMIGADTYTTAETYQAAVLAAGSCCAAVDAVLNRQVDDAVAIVRPPGHHAGSQSVEGFCLFNNIAVAARHAQANHAIQRVAIIDFDVHHGNGTQEIFYTDKDVWFASMHIYGRQFYPGSGNIDEVGQRNGNGTTVNIPLPSGVGDDGYDDLMRCVIEPLLTDFRPQLILVSAGFDAHWRDPLANGNLTLNGYTRMINHLHTWAKELCDGRIVFIVEGGYDLDVLSLGVLNLCHTLVGNEASIFDPIGASPYPDTEIDSLLFKVQQTHLLV